MPITHSMVPSVGSSGPVVSAINAFKSAATWPHVDPSWYARSMSLPSFAHLSVPPLWKGHPSSSLFSHCAFRSHRAASELIKYTEYFSMHDSDGSSGVVVGVDVPVVVLLDVAVLVGVVLVVGVVVVVSDVVGVDVTVVVAELVTVVVAVVVADDVGVVVVVSEVVGLDVSVVVAVLVTVVVAVVVPDDVGVVVVVADVVGVDVTVVVAVVVGEVVGEETMQSPNSPARRAVMMLLRWAAVPSHLSNGKFSSFPMQLISVSTSFQPPVNSRMRGGMTSAATTHSSVFKACSMVSLPSLLSVHPNLATAAGQSAKTDSNVST